MATLKNVFVGMKILLKYEERITCVGAGDNYFMWRITKPESITPEDLECLTKNGWERTGDSWLIR